MTALKNKFSWSFSSADLFLKCPKKYYHERIAKDVPYVQNDAAKRGEVIHAYLEYGVKAGTKPPIPIDYDKPENLDKWIAGIRKLMGQGYKVGSETKMAINRKLQPVTWFDDHAWQRTIIDLWVLHHDKRRLDVFDYKTGKVRITDQLELTAAIASYYFADKEFDTIRTTFVFIDQKAHGKGLWETHDVTIDRAKARDILKSWIPVLRDIDEAMETDVWTPKKSWMCGSCDVASCPFNDKVE